MTIADLIALRDIISSSIDKIIEVCTTTGKEFPSLNEPVHPSEFTPDGIRNHPEIADVIAPAVAASFQLIQTIQSPPLTLVTSAFKCALSFSLGVAERANVAEILRNAGPKGLHVNDIASKSTIDPKKLARILRYLATNHCFKEVEPDVFATNLLSSLLDTGKEVTPDFAPTKHVNTPGLAAIVGNTADENFKAFSASQDHLFDPKTAFSEEINETAFQKAYNTELDQWAYYDTPEGQYRRRRFAASMSGASKLHPPTAVVTGFDWDSVPKNGLVVDVGGGVGHVGLAIAKAYPELNFVIEDRPITIENAKDFWKTNIPEFVQAGKVHFIGLNFFEPQPSLPATPDVFLLRMVIHDWSDKMAIKLLRNLRNAASPNTRLLILDNIVSYACDTPSNPFAEERPPKPLLPNLGGANLLAYEVDLTVLSCLNSAERTLGGFTSVFKASGWKLHEIRKNSENKRWWPSIICVPA